MGRKAIGPVGCVHVKKKPVHLLKREGVRPDVPGLIGSILHQIHVPWNNNYILT